MTNGKERVLVHYICIIPELRRQNIGAVLMKSIFRRDEYHEKDIMAITSLPKRYRHDGSYETMVRFFTKFDFKDMSKNMKDGENDINKIVLKGEIARLMNCKKIIKKKCSLENWQSDHSYYELDNEIKYSIAYHLIERILHTRGPHFGWDEVDSNDYIDCPRKN